MTEETWSLIGPDGTPIAASCHITPHLETLRTTAGRFAAVTEPRTIFYDPTPITYDDETPIYVEAGDAMRETPEEAIARINSELDRWEDMSTAARWTPPDDEDELPSSGAVDWLERVMRDLELSERQLGVLERVAGMSVADGGTVVYHRSTDG